MTTPNQDNQKPQDWRIDYFRDSSKAMYSLLAAICARHGGAIRFDEAYRSKVLRELQNKDCEGGFDYSVQDDKLSTP